MEKIRLLNPKDEGLERISKEGFESGKILKKRIKGFCNRSRNKKELISILTSLDFVKNNEDIEKYFEALKSGIHVAYGIKEDDYSPVTGLKTFYLTKTSKEKYKVKTSLNIPEKFKIENINYSPKKENQ